MKKEDLHGFVPAVVTPFDAKGEIIEDAYINMVETLVGLGATAICVAGDNGESWALDPTERGYLVRLAKQTSNGRVPVIAGCSAPTLKTSLTYANVALENGADALLSMPQTYVLKATRNELLARFDSLYKATNAPIVLYNSPRRAGLGLSVEDIIAITGVASIIGIKESTRDYMHLTKLCDHLKDDLSIMVGPCQFIMPGIAMGARGFIATGPELLGPVAGEIANLAKTPNSDTAIEVHSKLTALYELLMGTGTWPSSFKAALNLIGHEAGIPREPVLPATDEDLTKIRSVLHKLDIQTLS